MGGLSCHVELEERNNVVAVDVSKNRIKVTPTVLGGDKIGNVEHLDRYRECGSNRVLFRQTTYTTRGIDCKSINTRTSGPERGLLQELVKRQTLCRTTCLEFDW